MSEINLGEKENPFPWLKEISLTEIKFEIGSGDLDRLRKKSTSLTGMHYVPDTLHTWYNLILPQAN